MTATISYSEAKTERVKISSGEQIAIRRIGLQDAKRTPLLLNTHFRGTMDHWDPLLIDSIGRTRPMIIFDNAGVGESEGAVPTQFAGWASVAIDLMRALNIPHYDVFGFSMGGMAAQQIALNAPAGVVRRLILAGTSPSLGEGLASSEPEPIKELIAAQGEEASRVAFLRHFFLADERHQNVGKAWWERMTTARKQRSDYVGEEGTQRQLAALGHWFSSEAEALTHGSYNRLHTLRIPVLIANGSSDVLVPTKNSIVLWEKVKDVTDATLHLYPQSGHGFLDEYAEEFAALINQFLGTE